MDSLSVLTCDVLVAGSGLSGLRAGLSACSKAPGLDVLLVTAGDGPSGASFTNVNNSLGIAVCENDREAGIFIENARRIAQPGVIHPHLTAIMAEQSLSVFRDLTSAGFRFTPDPAGSLRRYPCCFIPDPPLAYVFTDLPHAFTLMRNRFEAEKGRMLEGFVLKDLVPGCALFVHRKTGHNLAVAARAVVLATGGASGLFSRSLTGRGNLGFATALAGRLGAGMVNMPFVQFLWYETRTLSHWPCWSLVSPEIRITGPRGEEVRIPDEIREFCAARSRHGPMGHAMPGSAVDDWLLSLRREDGTVRCLREGNEELTVAPYAHAMNGGLLIDGHAATSVPGLFACGECAGGMHGANRVGGAMVLATQVFGDRAGRSAAEFAKSSRPPDPAGCMDILKHRLAHSVRDDNAWRLGLREIRNLMDRIAGPCPRPAHSEMAEHLDEIRRHASDWRLKLAAETARRVADHEKSS